MARIFITGVLGFAGRSLALRLLEEGHEVAGGYLDARELRGLPPEGRIRLVPLDVRATAQVEAALADERPDQIYHMAAIVPIRLSLQKPALTMEVNVVGTANLLEAIRKLGISPRIILPGSSEEYGQVLPHETPVTEQQLLRPTNPYGVSKAAQSLLGLMYFRQYGLQVVCARPFNMTGPGQTPDYACPAFARQIARIERGLDEPVVRVGNLSPKRDFSDIRDIMRAFCLLGLRGQAGEVYNTCNGQAYSMDDLLGRLLSMSTAKIEVRVDPARVRPVENEVLLGDNRKLIAVTAYKPQYTIDQTLRDVLDYWRAEAARA